MTMRIQTNIYEHMHVDTCVHTYLCTYAYMRGRDFGFWELVCTEGMYTSKHVCIYENDAHTCMHFLILVLLQVCTESDYKEAHTLVNTLDTVC